jgi:predicted nucleotidyltransferase
MLQQDIKQKIIEKLSANVNLYKVILFGSFAYGNPGKDSDIDLIVVTDDETMPRNYEENISHYLKVSSALRDIKKNIPMDLIVHTKSMYSKFIELGSLFSKEILKKGEILYEKHDYIRFEDMRV